MNDLTFGTTLLAFFAALIIVILEAASAPAGAGAAVERTSPPPCRLPGPTRGIAPPSRCYLQSHAEGDGGGGITETRDAAAQGSRYHDRHTSGGTAVTTTSVMVVEDDPAFLARFCRIVAQGRKRCRWSPPSAIWHPHGRAIQSAGTGCTAHGPRAARRQWNRADPGDRRTPGPPTSWSSPSSATSSMSSPASRLGPPATSLRTACPRSSSRLIAQLRAGGSPISPVIARQLLRRMQPAATGGNGQRGSKRPSAGRSRPSRRANRRCSV